MDMNKLEREIRDHEGEVLHAYQDSLGYWTIGVGRLIDQRRGGGITRMESTYLMRNDIASKMKALDNQMPWWRHLAPVQKRALVNMSFQLGVSGLQKFRLMLSALRRGDAEEAAREALNSKWAQQTPRRAKEVADMLRDTHI